MYVLGTTPEFMEGSAPKYSLPPWAVTNGEWRGGSNSISRSRRYEHGLSIRSLVCATSLSQSHKAYAAAGVQPAPIVGVRSDGVSEVCFAVNL